MALAFKGRWESRFTIPSGGASVSAQVANGGSAATVTVPAGNFYLTAAGGVSGLLETLQGLLNDNVQGYPQTAAAMQAAVGYGTWTAGWLFNESSGNLAGAFGGITMTPNGTPTYGTEGPAGGIDKAIGFDAPTEYFTGADVLNVAADADLILAWVGKVTANPAGSRLWFQKGRFAAPGWTLWRSISSNLRLTINNAVNAEVNIASIFGEYHVGLAIADRTANVARIAVRGLTSGTTLVSSSVDISAHGTLENADPFLFGDAGGATDTDLLIAAAYAGTGVGIGNWSASISAALANFANAINSKWSVSLSDTGQVIINWSGYETPTHSLSWTSTVLRDVLGFDANISNATSATTGADQSPACWLPDAPFSCDDHPSMTPDETDTRSSESPTGVVLSLSGTTKYAHTNALWQRSPVDRIRESSASLTNASLEVFFRNCIAGQGDISWFTPCSPLQIYWNNAGTLELLGSDGQNGSGVAGWTPVGVSSFSQLARPSQRGWVGQFDVRIPRLVSSG